VDQDLFRRAKRLMVLNGEPGRWNEQAEYPGAFYERKHPMTDEHIRAHLRGERWLGSRLPSDRMSDRVVFDIDAKTPDDVPRRNLVYQELRDFIGRERGVLVWQTPSGHGLRAAYRIPPTSMRELAAAESVGLLPDALRAAGLDPSLGTLEIYPAAHRCDRQLFGRMMPLLDADSLEPIPGADLGDEYSEAKLRHAVALVEDWHQQEDEELVGALASQPRLPVPVDVAPAGPEPELIRSRHLSPGAETVQLATGGLTEFRSRYRTEFRVGRDMWLWPELFADLGVPADPTREEVARGLATWLAERSNGMSRDWRTRLEQYGREGAIEWWTAHYLRLNDTDDLAPVDRMRRAALALNPDAWPTVHLTPDEHRRILEISNWARWSSLLDGKGQYRFEAWACACLRTVKRQIRRERWPATRLPHAQVEIKAEWMAGWPYGKTYAHFRDILESRGMFVRKHTYRAPQGGVPGRAITYEAPQPEWIRRGELPMSVEEVEEAIEPIRIHGRAATVDEAYHALYLADRTIDLKDRYGASTAKAIQKLQQALRPPPVF
jgi:hypothetical protein